MTFIILPCKLALVCYSYNAASSECPQGLPLFGDREPSSVLPDQIQTILPTYIFTCSGRVVQWGACISERASGDRYDIYFEVWRQTGVDGCYSIVGSNFVNSGDPETQGSEAA